jgi:inosine-uridine nucleoside N-ribohydrolase
VKFGAPRDTDHPELRQPLAMEVWESILQTMKPGTNITVLTNGPLTNLAKVVSVKNISSRIQVSIRICV